MKSGKIIRNAFLLTFLSAESIIYFLFIADDFFNHKVLDNTALKYVSILLVLAFTLISVIAGKIMRNEHGLEKDECTVISAVLFTALSDLFLLVLDKYYEIGVSCFIVVQLMYFLRLNIINRRKKKEIIISISSRIILWIIIIPILIFINMFDLLNVITVFYFINLAFNFLDAFILYVREKEKGVKKRSLMLLMIGLLLFIGCDISVGIYNLFDKMYAFSWFFYLPSQILIPLSGLKLYGFTLGGNNDRVQTAR